MAIDFNLGGLFGGDTTTGINALLTPAQRALMSRNANLSAAAALLQASGPSRQRVGIGQALGAALQAGQGAYEKAQAGSLQELLLGEKLKEAQTERERNANYLQMLGGGAPTTAPIPAANVTPLPAAAIDGPGVQVFAPDAPVTSQVAPTSAPNMFANFTADQRRILALMPRTEGLKFVAEALKPEATPETIRTLRALGLPETVAGLRQMDKPEASPSEIRILQATNTPVTFENIMKLRQSGAPKTVVDMTGGQKGFENEMKLGSSFKSEPIYKDFNDMKTAFNQVVSSLSSGTPIGDVAGATKIMKLLDPGSVVRESELGIAMAAGGRLDRLQNYFNNMMTGQKLTPTQREDFQALANELYAAAGQAYNQKRDEYKGFGQAYNFKNLDTALGPAANIPSLMRKPTPSAPGAAGTPRRKLDDIFGGR